MRFSASHSPSPTAWWTLLRLGRTGWAQTSTPIRRARRAADLQPVGQQRELDCLFDLPAVGLAADRLRYAWLHQPVRRHEARRPATDPAETDPAAAAGGHAPLFARDVDPDLNQIPS